MTMPVPKSSMNVLPEGFAILAYAMREMRVGVICNQNYAQNVR